MKKKNNVNNICSFDNIKQKILQRSDLESISKKYHVEGKRIVFCTGCYDILQSGHAVFFNQCKQFGEILVVGVGSDAVIKKLKGDSRPINPENNRVYLVASLQNVDYAILNDEELLKGSNKIDFVKILPKLKPDVFVLNDDDKGIEEKRLFCDKYGVKLELVARVVPDYLKATSSTEIINKSKYK